MGTRSDPCYPVFGKKLRQNLLSSGSIGPGTGSFYRKLPPGFMARNPLKVTHSSYVGCERDKTVPVPLDCTISLIRNVYDRWGSKAWWLSPRPVSVHLLSSHSKHGLSLSAFSSSMFLLMMPSSPQEPSHERFRYRVDATPPRGRVPNSRAGLRGEEFIVERYESKIENLTKKVLTRRKALTAPIFIAFPRSEGVEQVVTTTSASRSTAAVSGSIYLSGGALNPINSRSHCSDVYISTRVYFHNSRPTKQKTWWVKLLSAMIKRPQRT